jgi:hypothetical protein
MEKRVKFLGVPLSKAYTKLDDGSLLVRGRFTSDNMDESGDVITKAATMKAVPKYKQWGNIRYMHLPRPVAKVIAIGEEDGLEWNEVEIQVIDPQAVFEVENGLLKALSVGIYFNYKSAKQLPSGGLEINEYALSEISLVDHPANYDASLMIRSKSVDDSVAALVAAYGMEAFAKSAAVIVTKELEMAEETEDLQVIEETVQVETPVVVEDVPVDEPVATEANSEVNLSDLLKAFNSLSDKFDALQATFAEAIAQKSAPVQEEQAVVATQESPAEDEAVSEDVPAERRGAVPQEKSTPTTEPAQEQPQAEQSVVTLKDALGKYFKSR